MKVQYIECKKCEMTEEQPENSSRKNMQNFEVIRLLNNNVAEYKCCACGTINISKIVKE